MIDVKTKRHETERRKDIRKNKKYNYSPRILRNTKFVNTYEALLLVRE